MRSTLKGKNEERILSFKNWPEKGKRGNNTNGILLKLSGPEVEMLSQKVPKMPCFGQNTDMF